MTTFILNETNTVANTFLQELRQVDLQQDRMRFRRNIERMGEILAYELSKKLPYERKELSTPLARTSVNVISEQPVLVTVMRAGLPFFQGFLNYFDKADCGFIGAYRKEGENNITIKLEYLATPTVDNRIVILVDPMLATGRSIIDSINALQRNGKPKAIHIASLVAAPEGMKFLEENLKLPFTLWTCAVDDRLNHDFYIVPGLGDAGDLSFGTKI